MPRFALALMLTLPLLAGCGGLGGEPEIVVTMPATASARSAGRGWQPDIVNGARIFAERCVDCHGLSGDGEGELVLAGSVERPLDMTDRAKVGAKSPLDWFEIITEGRLETLMPPWESALDETERWDVALFSYTLAYDDEWLARGEGLWRERCGGCELPAAIPPVYSDVDYGAKLNRELFESTLSDAEAEAAAAFARLRTLAPSGIKAATEPAARGVISGRVLHGGAGRLAPAETVLQLRYGNSDVGYRVAETTIDAAGAFQFEDIPLGADLNYAVGAVYDGRLFSQRVSPGQEQTQTITIYDATNDPLVVSVARIDLYIEPTRLEALGAGLYISQVLRYRNRSDRIYTSGRGFDDGREAALLIQFPEGAKLLSGDAQGRYVLIEDLDQLPDSAIDTLPVMPGESHDVALEYWLPYAEAAQYEQAFNNIIDGRVTVTLASDLSVASDWLRRDEARDVEAGIREYSADISMRQDARISFGISGDPFATSSDDAMVITSETLPALLLGAIALAAALIGGGGLMKRRKDDSGGEIDQLVGELARLEEDHDQGRINHDLYHQRRRRLKADLRQLMGAAHD